MNKQQEFFWLVGILEGEGCFSKTQYSPLIHVHMTDKDTMEKVARMLDTKLESHQPKGDRKKAYTARIYGDKAIQWMEDIYYYMSNRRKARIDVIRTWAFQRPGVYKKLNREAVKAIRWAYEKGKLQKEIAKVYNISQSLVSLVIREEAWTHV